MTDNPPAADAPPNAPRARSNKARLAARRAKAGREERIFDLLTSGLSIAEIALQDGVPQRQMRETVQRLLARREANPAEGFVALQTARLSDAMKVAYSKMWDDGGDLQAVDRVLKITRELERYQGLRPALEAPPTPPVARLAPPQPVRALPAPIPQVTENDIASD